MIVLAAPQHPIKAQRIKFYDDPVFREMVARQEGREFPYPPSVEGAGPWGDRGLAEDGLEEQVPSGTQRSRRRQARVMRATPKKSEAVDVRAEDLDREDGVPPQWEELLDRQEGIIDDLLAEQS